MPRRKAASASSPAKVVRIGVLAFDGCMASSAAMPLELFGVANVLGSLIGAAPADVRFEARIVTAARRREVVAGSGIVLDGSKARGRCDVVIVPAIWHRHARDLAAEAERLGREVATIRAAYQDGAIVAAVCSGTVLLAQAGLLDGRTATTSWWLGEFFRRRYPAVRLALDELVTADGRVWCSGAATSSFSLCLKLVEHFAGAEVAALVARFMLIDPNRGPQTSYAVEPVRLAADPAIAKTQAWLGRNYARAVTLDEMARVAAMSTRTLIRRFRAATGDTPLTYLQRLRVERAKALLTTTGLPVQTVMDRAGYADMSSFRKLFRSHTGLVPSVYRERFQIRRRKRAAAGA
jgi:transcriptional regulator GlxA family with amidase domain